MSEESGIYEKVPGRRRMTAIRLFGSGRAPKWDTGAGRLSAGRGRWRLHNHRASTVSWMRLPDLVHGPVSVLSRQGKMLPGVPHQRTPTRCAVASPSPIITATLGSQIPLADEIPEYQYPSLRHSNSPTDKSSRDHPKIEK
jgi:hypothetical protein